MKKSLLKISVVILLSALSINLFAAEYIIPVTPNTACYDSSNNGEENGIRKIYMENSSSWVDFHFYCASAKNYDVYVGYMAPSGSTSDNIRLFINDGNCGNHFTDQAAGWTTPKERNCGNRGFQAGHNKISICGNSQGYNLIYIRLTDNGSADDATKTLPANLNFYFTSYEGDKVISGSNGCNFLYDSKAEDYIKRGNYDGKNSVTFKQNNYNVDGAVIASSRGKVTFPTTGSYKFTIHSYSTENYSCTKPYIIVNNKIAGGGSITVNGSQDIEITLDVDAGSYPIAVCFPYSGRDEKLWFSSMDIEADITIPDHVYVYGDVNNIGWHANNAVDLTYNSTTQLFTGDVTFQDNRYFRFSTVKANDDNSGGWDYVNGSAYGASTSNATPSIGATNWNGLTSGTNNYQAANASVTYYMTVDWTNSRFSLSPYYNVSYSAGTNGAFASTPTTSSGASVSNNSSVLDGETVTFTAAPTTGYKVDKWTVNSVEQSETGNSLSVTVTAATTVSVTFKEKGPEVCTDSYVIDCGSTADYVVPSAGTRVPSTQSGEAGIYNDYYTNYHGSGYYDFKGASESEIYYFVHLPSAQYTFTVYTATDKYNQYLNVYKKVGGASGDITYNGNNYQKVISQTNSYNNYNQFGVGVTVSGQNLLEEDYIIGLYSNGDYAAYDQVVITATTDVFCVEASPYTVTINRNNNSYGTVTGADDYYSGATVNITATPNSGYAFSGWTVNSGGATLADATAASTSFTMPAANVTLTANFVPTHTVSITATNGSAIGAGTYGEGATVNITATPNSGYGFTGWTVNSGGASLANASAASTSFTMPSANVSLTANFSVIDNVIITGTSNAISDKGWSGNGGSMTITNNNSACGPSHNVLKIDYSGMTGDAYASKCIADDDAYNSASSLGATGFGFYYMTETSSDAVAFVLEYNTTDHDQYKVLLPATNGVWKYKYLPVSDANSWNRGEVVFFMNKTTTSSETGTSINTANASGTFYLADLSATSVTSKADILCTGIVVNYSATEHGTLDTHTCAGVSFTSGDRLTEGAALQFTATPASGYGIDGWWVKEGAGEFVEQGNTKGATTFNYTVLSNEIEVQVRFATVYTLTLACNPAAGGTPTGAGQYVAGQVVHINVTPAANHTFQSWTNNSTGYQESAIREFDYVMPASNTTLTANFLVTTCSSSYTIQCETEYVTITSGTSAPSALSVKDTGGDLYYSSYHGTGYLDYKASRGETYYFVHLPAGSYSFQVYHINGSDKWINIYSTNNNGNTPTVYGGTTYYKQSWDELTSGVNSGQAPFTSNTITKNNLSEGDYLIGLWGIDNTAYDQIVITETGGNQVFCETEESLYMIGTIYGTDYLWNPNSDAGQMADLGNGIYKIVTRIANSETAPFTGGEFALTTVKSGDWTYVNSHRFGPSTATYAVENGGVYSFSAQNNSNKWTLPFAGTYTITANTKSNQLTVEGPDLYLFGQTAATSYNTSTAFKMTYDADKECYVANTRIANSAGGSANGKVSFSVAESGSADYLNNSRYGPATDNTVPNTAGSNNTIALNGNKWFSVPAGNYIIRVSKDLTKVTFCSALQYDIWTGSVAVSEDYHGKGLVAADTTITGSSQNYWLNQVVLGPEHFQTAQVGDTLKVTYTNITEDPKGALQSTKTYNALPGRAYHTSNDTEVTYDNGTTLKDFYLPSNGYYHIITAASLDSLKTSGVIVKGKGHTITKVSLHATCDNYSLRTTAPDKTTVSTSFDLRSMPYVVGGAGFNLGEWEHKLEFPKEVFRSVEVGDYINVYVTSSVGTTISFRCNVPYILADDKAGKVCPSYGDISFDRTIDNLDGDQPVVVGDNDYAIITMEVTADMLTRLNETGFIIAGKGSIINRVESVADSITLGSISTTESVRIPTVVNHLTIWQGSQATNNDDIEVRGSITYIRPAVGGVHSNVLNKWYTFCLPFSLQKVEVYDEADERWYDGMQSIYRTKASEGDNPQGYGYYYLNWLNDENLTGLGDEFRVRWDYVDSSTSTAKTSEDGTYTGSRYGYAKQHFPYIIMFTDWDGTDYYFRDNPIIRYVGGPQIISGSDNQVKYPGDGSQYYYYANNTLTTMEFSSAYTLSETDNTFYLRDNARVAPFECYIQATDGFKASYRAIGFNMRPIPQEGGVTTGIEDVFVSGNILQTLTDKAINIFDVSGKLMLHIDAHSGEPIQLDLPQGVYLLQAGTQTMKVML